MAETFLHLYALLTTLEVLKQYLGISQPLSLRLQVEGALIGFYRLDNNQKLLVPSELATDCMSAFARSTGF